MTHTTLADHFASRPHPIYTPEKTTVHCAVIEWPYPHDDSAPALILADSPGQMGDTVRAEVALFAASLTDDDGLADFLTERICLGWPEWLAELRDRDGAPVITTYTKEFRQWKP